MYWLHLEVDAERGDLLFQRLDAEREAIFHGGTRDGQARSQVEAQALLNLLATRGAEQASSTKKVHGLVLIDIATLTLGAHERSVSETAAGRPLPPEVVRALICSAEVSFGFTMAGRVVHHLANASLATADQRRQLRMMHRSCVGSGCDRPFEHCQIHHVVPRSRDGPTTIPLMVPLCSDHHDAIHHGGWTLTIDEHRNITWTAPDGTVSEVPFFGLADTDQPHLFPTDPTAA